MRNYLQVRRIIYCRDVETLQSGKPVCLYGMIHLSSSYADILADVLDDRSIVVLKTVISKAITNDSMINLKSFVCLYAVK